MIANLKLISLFALLSLPFFIKAQCPPNIDIILDDLILQYTGSAPSNLKDIDTDLPGAIYTNIEVTPVLTTTWQTYTEDFTGITLTGDITIHYTDGSSEDCEYDEGSLVGLLPVDLSSFSGSLSEDNILLSWTTENEENNAGFEIEYSYDGNRFEKIGMVLGAGDSESTRSYTFMDKGIRNRALSNTAYYRLVQIDFDGTKTYTEVLAIDLELVFEKFKITKMTGLGSSDSYLSVHYYSPSTVRKVNIILADLRGQVLIRRSIYQNLV